jgi:hypothetical protein
MESKMAHHSVSSLASTQVRKMALKIAAKMMDTQKPNDYLYNATPGAGLVKCWNPDNLD